MNRFFDEPDFCRGMDNGLGLSGISDDPDPMDDDFDAIAEDFFRYYDGVALIVQCSRTGKILVLREKKSKPEIKRAGQLSIPAETVKEGEVTTEALRRLIGEEIGAQGKIPSIESAQRVGVIPWMDTLFVYALVVVFAIQCDTEFVPCPEDEDDVEFFGWMSIENLLERKTDTRPGFKASIRQFENWKKRE